MTPSPTITISSLDLARLEALLDSHEADDASTTEALWAELDRARVLEPEEMPPDVVTMNSRVRFRMEPTGGEFERSLAYPRDLDGAPDRISILAPVGAALLGLSVGQRIEWSVPGGGTVGVRILDIPYQPEANGRFDL
jgi:regulator of nucleoside diphosphate kinase